MRNIQDTRLECMRMAATLATAKAILPAEIVTKATELFNWVQKLDDEPERPRPGQMEALEARFPRRAG